MRFRIIIASAVALMLGGCASVEITPARIRTAPVPPAEQEETIRRWVVAVNMMNGFLQSPYRRTLPEGMLELDSQGLMFVTPAGRWPVRIRQTSFGDLLPPFGFMAQERSDGFVVGRVKPRRDGAIDNSLFRQRKGPAAPASIAGLILHELTHEVYAEGAINPRKTLAYYAEVVFLFRYRNHTDERKAYATSEEFWRFMQAWGKDEKIGGETLADFERHLADGPTKRCQHGPFPATPRPPAGGPGR